jgi:hypothetical protein
MIPGGEETASDPFYLTIFRCRRLGFGSKLWRVRIPGRESVELRFQGFKVSVQGFKLKNEFGLSERFSNLETLQP